MASKLRAFTLIELLVVVTIIVILLALLTPALDRAMAMADRVKCLSNLKVVGTAIGQFTNDKKNRYPQYDNWNHLFGSQSQSNIYSDQFQTTKNRPLNAYLGYTGDNDVVKVAECPLDRGDILYGVSNAYLAYGTSYLSAFAGDYFRASYAFGVGPGSGEPLASRKTTIFKLASSKMLVADWMWHANRHWKDAQTRWHDEPRAGEAEVGIEDPEATRKLNTLFADLHAEYFDKIEVREIEDTYISPTYPPSEGWKWW